LGAKEAQLSFRRLTSQCLKAVLASRRQLGGCALKLDHAAFVKWLAWRNNCEAVKMRLPEWCEQAKEGLDLIQYLRSRSERVLGTSTSYTVCATAMRQSIPSYWPSSSEEKYKAYAPSQELEYAAPSFSMSEVSDEGWAE
jgi:hypothetical protein